MTTIFTRNLAIFIISALILKCAISSPVEYGDRNPFPDAILKYRMADIAKQGYQNNKSDKYTEMRVSNKSISEVSCLSANTSFSVTNPYFGVMLTKEISNKDISKYLLETNTVNNSVGSVNIVYSSKYFYNTYDKQKEPWSINEAVSLSDILLNNKLIVRVPRHQSEILDKRMSDSPDVEYIVAGTVLDEIYNSSGIHKIEKIKLGSNDVGYYLLELNSSSEFNPAGGNFLSRIDNIDNIRRFVNR